MQRGEAQGAARPRSLPRLPRRLVLCDSGRFYMPRLRRRHILGGKRARLHPLRRGHVRKRWHVLCVRRRQVLRRLGGLGCCHMRRLRRFHVLAHCFSQRLPDVPGELCLAPRKQRGRQL